MSLQIAAQHLSSQGRGNDSMLVHMSPREVSSLNALAKAHGGELTINPKTGLAEAGFLESLLPMVAGVGMTVASGGMINPMTAGLITGGLGYAMTGSLSKGLMMGLGAYGGAGLGSALAESGMQAAALQPPVAPVAPVAPLPPSIMTQPPPMTPLTDSILPDVSQSVIANPSPMTAQSVGFPAQPVPTPSVAGVGYESALANQKAAYEGGTFMDRLGTMGEGVKTLGKEGGFSNLYNNLGGNPMSVISKVGSAAAPTVSEAMKEKPPEEEKPDTSMGQRYAFSPGYVNPMPSASASGQEKTFMNPSYRQVSDAEAKKIYGYADGGVPTANPAAPPVPASYTAAEPTTPISTPAPAFSIPEVDSLSDLVRMPESQGLVNAYLSRPAPIDAQGQYNDYLQKTLNAPPMAVANSGVRAAVASPTAGSSAEYVYDANTRQYVKNPAYQDPEAAAKAKKKPSITYIGGKAGAPPKDAGINASGSRMARGSLFATGGGISESKSAPIDVQAQYNDYLQRTLNASPTSAPNSGVRAAVANPSRAETTAAAEKKLNIGSDGGFSLGRSTGLSTNNNEELGNALLSTVNKIGSDIHQVRFATGGGISNAQYNLGGYSDGGRLLRGPGDGVSDSIPAVIGKKQPARLADGEFVVPARIVSELGNGSTEAGARKLYAMMDRIQKARGKTVGKGKVAKNSRSEKYLPA